LDTVITDLPGNKMKKEGGITRHMGAKLIVKTEIGGESKVGSSGMFHIEK